MMEPAKFPQSNKILTAPKGLDNCGVLPVFTNGEICVSLWKLSDEEVQKIIETKHVWLFVWSGVTQPPVSMSISESVFEDPEPVHDETEKPKA